MSSESEVRRSYRPGRTRLPHVFSRGRLSFAECDFRDADDLVSLIQIQRHGRRSQKYVHHPSVLTQISRWTLLPSRHSALLRARSRFLDDHPFVRSMVKLAAPPSRFVILLCDPPLS